MPTQICRNKYLRIEKKLPEKKKMRSVALPAIKMY